MIKLQLKCLISVFSGVFLLGYSNAAEHKVAAASGPKERVLARPLFNSVSSIPSGALVIDRRLFRQLNVANNADVLPSVAAKKLLAVKENEPVQTQTTFARSLEEYEGSAEQRLLAQKENFENQSALYSTMYVGVCDHRNLHRAECIPEIRRLASMPKKAGQATPLMNALSR
ncbi:hypothetical protein [Janthinobacterium sp. B9-8]|uniref:hypothetical protein n=1 Tax=Janthinobacterium sp. B9-8 TaxID=1236179 RepID=UPI0012E3868A|nr:hypothetical protein [Janthinobacterium sp. B9-8]